VPTVLEVLAVLRVLARTVLRRLRVPNAFRSGSAVSILRTSTGSTARTGTLSAIRTLRTAPRLP